MFYEAPPLSFRATFYISSRQGFLSPNTQSTKPDIARPIRKCILDLSVHFGGAFGGALSTCTDHNAFATQLDRPTTN